MPVTRREGKAKRKVKEPHRIDKRTKRQGGGDKEETEPEIIRLSADENNTTSGCNAFLDLFPNENVKNISEFSVPAGMLKCAEDRLTMHVSKDLWVKIWSGQYINLANLLKKHQVEGQSASNLHVNEHGMIEFKQSAPKKVLSIRDWTDAFLIYTSIYTQKHSSMTGDLLQYMSLIREAEARSGGTDAWRVYDENFRHRQAVKMGSWAHIEPDLWLLSMTPVPQYNGNSTQSQVTSHMTKRKKSIRPCFDYNSVHGCSFRQCRFDHVCLGCRGSHSQHNCPRSFQGQSFQAAPMQSFQSRFAKQRIH